MHNPKYASSYGLLGSLTHPSDLAENAPFSTLAAAGFPIEPGLQRPWHCPDHEQDGRRIDVSPCRRDVPGSLSSTQRALRDG